MGKQSKKRGGPFGARVQREVIALLCDEKLSVKEVITDHWPKISPSQMYEWKKHYQDWGETPYETGEFKRRHLKTWRKSKVVTQEFLDRLKEVVDESPELYLDEIQGRIVTASGVTLARSTISTLLRKRLGYSLRVITAKAVQRDEERRLEYRLQLAMYGRPEVFIFIDETHKDRNASRRRLAWGKRGEDNEISELFCPGGETRYSLLAAADIHGFVEGACEIVQRSSGDADTDETHGTVDADRFVSYVENILVPCLGRHDLLEPRSVVVLDNATLHDDDRVVRLIEAAGARIIYTAPYSPDLNPIERAFHQYKATLKRWTKTFGRHHAHVLGLKSVTSANMMNYYRRVGIRNVPTPLSPGVHRRNALISAVVAGSVAGKRKR